MPNLTHLFPRNSTSKLIRLYSTKSNNLTQEKAVQLAAHNKEKLTVVAPQNKLLNHNKFAMVDIKRFYSLPRKNLTHINDQGRATMVDIINKPVTIRDARAMATVKVGPVVTKLISENGVKKGDVLSIAQISGILAAKKTSEIIPLCHNIPLTKCVVTAALDQENEEVKIFSEIQCESRTGVEMEALTAVSVAALTIYDMCKAVDREMVISNVCLISKSGGRSGEYVREEIEINEFDTRPITRLQPHVGPM